MSQTSTPDTSTKSECCTPEFEEPDRQQDPEDPTAVKKDECCVPDTSKMVQECPCVSTMKRHCKTAIVAMGVLFLAFLISQVGGILGIIAFFRTL